MDTDEQPGKARPVAPGDGAPRRDPFTVTVPRMPAPPRLAAPGRDGRDQPLELLRDFTVNVQGAASGGRARGNALWVGAPGEEAGLGEEMEVGLFAIKKEVVYGFLANVRASLITLTALPLSILTSILALKAFGSNVGAERNPNHVDRALHISRTRG